MRKGNVNNDKFKVSKLVIIGTFFLFLILIGRLCYLCLVDYKVGNSTIAAFIKNRNTKEDIIMPKRGTIYDINSNVLANDVVSYTLIAYLSNERVDAKGNKMSKSLGNVIVPADMVRLHGSDILRLWVASTDYTEDVRISDDLIKQVKESYRKIRNTYKFMLGNLKDFDYTKDSVKYEDMPYYDKYMMNELNKFTKNVLEEYNNYNFQNVYKLVNNFVSFTLSNFYLDFTKDILYIEKADSLVRRSVQTVLYNILNNEVKLLAPILPYTSEEVYSLLPHTEESVHLTDMPEVVTYSDSTEVEELFNLFFELKDKVNKKLEEARNEKLIGSALEAVVKINLEPKYNEVKEKLGSYLHQLFIVSKVEYTTDGEEVVVEKSTGEKCNRCWNYVDHLNGDICDRCHNIINS